MSDVLRTEQETYERNRISLLEKAEGRFVLVKGDQIAGIYHCKRDAVEQGYQKFGNVPFLVKQILRFERPQTIVACQSGS